MNFFDIYGIVFITDRNKKKEIADGYKSLLGFGQARDKPVRNYSNGEYSFNFGQSTSGKSVNEIRNIDKGLSDGLECIG